MIRGEIWTVAGGGNYTGKPRPALIVQSTDISDIESVVVCPFTTDGPVSGSIRIAFEPTSENGLRQPCRLMTDKISAHPVSKFGQRIGIASSADMARVNDALMVFLGLAG